MKIKTQYSIGDKVWIGRTLAGLHVQVVTGIDVTVEGSFQLVTIRYTLTCGTSVIEAKAFSSRTAALLYIHDRYKLAKERNRPVPQPTHTH